MAIVMTVRPDLEQRLCSPYYDGLWDLIPNVLHTHCHQTRPLARAQGKCDAQKCPATAGNPKKGRQGQKEAEETQLDKSEEFVKILDVREYRPEELDTKMVGNSIIVEGRHEEREDGYGFISRHFVRRYVLPKEFDAERLKVSLSEEGQLTIRAPRLRPVEDGAQKQRKEVVVPIRETGQPHSSRLPTERSGEKEKR